MDVHIAREAVTSWKDFVVRYLLIVLGILSAWAVNQWSEARAHRHVAEQARGALRAELQNDLKDLRESLDFDRAAIAKLQPFRTRLFDALKAGRSERDIDAAVVAPWQDALQDKYPTLRRDAWDAAIAGQAVAHLGADELRRYSAAYAAMRDLETFGTAGLSVGGADLRRRFVDWSVNRRIGRLDAAELARLLVLWSSVMQDSVLQLEQVDAAVSAALQDPALPAAAPASGAAG